MTEATILANMDLTKEPTPTRAELGVGKRPNKFAPAYQFESVGSRKRNRRRNFRGKHRKHKRY